MATSAAADPTGALTLASGSSGYLDTGSTLTASSGGLLVRAVSANAAGDPQGTSGPLSVLAPGGAATTALAAAFQNGTASIAGGMIAALDPATGTVSYRSVSGSISGSSAAGVATAGNFDGAAPSGWVMTRNIQDPGSWSQHITVQNVSPASTTDLSAIPTFDPTRGTSVILPGPTGVLAAVAGATAGTTRHEFVRYTTPGSYVRLDDGAGTTVCGPASVGATAAAWVEASSSTALTSTLVRAPLDGSSAQRTSLPLPCSAISSAPVATATATGLVADPGTGRRLFTVPASGGALVASSGLVLTRSTLTTDGTSFLLLLGSSTAGSRIGALADASSTPSTVYSFPSSPLVASSVAIGPGRAAWTDNAQQTNPVWSRPVSGTATLTLGSTALQASNTTAADAAAVAVSGQRTVYVTSAPSAQPGLTASALWLAAAGGPPRQVSPTLPAISRPSISGTWVLYATTSGTGTVWYLLDLSGGSTTTLPTGNVVDYAIGGDVLASLRSDGSVWRQSLAALAAGGSTPIAVLAAAGPLGTLSGRVAASPDVVAWVRQQCDLVGGTCSTAGGFRDVRTGAPAITLPDAGGQQVLALSDSYLVYQNTSGQAVARSIAGATTTVVTTGIGSTTANPSVSVSGSTVAWLGGGLPRVAPLPYVTSPPRVLGAPIAPTSVVLSQSGTWSADVVTSAPLTSCSYALTSTTGPVTTLPCDPAAMAVGEAVASWDGTVAGTAVPAATYTWTLTAAGADGALQSPGGSSAAPTGAVTLTTGSGFTPISPCRALDTRSGTGTCTGVTASAAAPLAGGTVRSLRVVGLAGVPADASAVVLNVTVVGATASTYVTAYPHGSPRPLASNLNVSSAAARANLVTVPVGTGGAVDFFSPAGQVNLAVDLSGYYEPAAGSGFAPVGPCRVFDTRHGAGTCTGAPSGALAPSAPLGTGQTMSVPVRGVEGVPADANAVVLNVTAVGATQSTFVTVWPGALPRPATSSLNVSGSGAVPGLVIVPIGSDGRIQLYNYAGPLNLVADLAGYFAPAAPATYAPVAPCRVLDTRRGIGSCPDGIATSATPLVAGPTGALRVKVAGIAGVPATATAVVLNITAVGATPGTYVTVWPGGQPQPATSNVNATGPAPVANLVVVPLGSDGTISIGSGSGNTDVIADLAGYFA